MRNQAQPEIHWTDLADQQNSSPHEGTGLHMYRDNASTIQEECSVIEEEDEKTMANL